MIKKPICTVSGEWNGIMHAKYSDGKESVFVDTKNVPVVKKLVKPLDEQGDFESRKLWKEVTMHLKNKNIEDATEYKRFLEQRQREEAKTRKDLNVSWKTKHFNEVGEHWVYDKPLVKRIDTTE